MFVIYIRFQEHFVLLSFCHAEGEEREIWAGEEGRGTE
jgi:hypothetical protein